jgi:hypothetical protein
MMTLDQMTLEEKIRLLPGDQRREVEDFVEFLLVKQRRAELERVAVERGWPPDFFAQTAGSIDDPTFTRHPQGEAEERSSLEWSAL